MNVKINPSEYKVLIVDDIISNVLLLKVLLNNEKFQIVTVGNGTEALAQVKKEKPDLVLLDVMMPDISGFDVATQMKADPEMSDIPIIFLTALNSTADIVKGFQVGGNDFISKPFNKEEWAAQKQAQRKEAYEMIDNTCAEMLADGDAFGQYLEVQGRFDRYSVNNAILVSAQMPEATSMKDKNAWKQSRVNVN